VIQKLFLFLMILAVLVLSGAGALMDTMQIVLHKIEMKQKIKTELINTMDSELLVVFTSNQLKNAEWEHESEFFLGDEKYDVVKVLDTNQKKYYYCLNDKHEEELFEKANQNQNSKNNFEEVMKKIILKLDLCEWRFNSDFSVFIIFGNLCLNYQYDDILSLLKPPTVA
jgi:hypothetical protein